MSAEPRFVRAAAILALAVSGLLAAGLFRGHWQAPEALWTNLDGDRHCHWLLGLEMGLDLRQGNLFGFLRDFEAVRTWPSLHAVLVSLVVAVAGPDYRFAVVPSLAAWALSGWLAFRLAVRLAPWAPAPARMAGGIAAAAFFWASPAHRAYAIDPMLESLGACLTLACLDLQLSWRRERTLRSARRLALGLFLLFTAKYNYWLLVVVPMAAAEAWSRRHDVPAWLVAWAKALCQPSVAIAWAPLAAWTALGLAGFGVKRPSHDQFTYPLYLVFLVRFAWGWRSRFVPCWRQTPPNARAAAWLLAVPIGVWFLLPYRFQYFLYYIGPHNGPMPGPHGLVPGTLFHLPALAGDYHAGAAALAAAAVLGVLGALALLRRGGRGEALALIVLLVSFFATVRHPNLKARMSHSWIPALWALAGTGVAALGTAAARRHATAGPALAFAAAGGAAFLGSGEFGRPGRSQEHAFDVRRSVVPLLAEAAAACGAGPAAAFGTKPIRFAATWPALAAGADPAALETRVKGFGRDPAANQAAFAAWLAQTPARTVVLIDPKPGSAWRFSSFDEYEQFRDLLAGQTAFRRESVRGFDEGRCELSVWRRNDVAAAGAALRR